MQLNQAITITLRLTEHANIFLNTYAAVVLIIFLCSLFFLVQGASNVSPLQPSDLSTILNILNYHCRCIVKGHLLAVKSNLVEKFEPSSEYSLLWGSEYVSDFLSSQKPLLASKQVRASSQNIILSSHEYSNLMHIGLAGL